MTEKRASVDRDDHITDEGGAWKYFAPMLHMDDDDLDPYEYRLLGHYRRVCGENGGKCNQSTRTIATVTRMSTGKVSNARKRLAALGRIRIVYTKKTCEITLKDCWSENIERYAKRSPDEHVHIVNSSKGERVHEVNTSTEGERSPGETKKELKEKQPTNTHARASASARGKSKREIELEEFEARWKAHRDTAIELMHVWGIRTDFIDPDKMVQGSRETYLKVAEQLDAAEFDRLHLKAFRKFLENMWERKSWSGAPTVNSMVKYAEEFRASRQRQAAQIIPMPSEPVEHVPADGKEYIAWLSEQMGKSS